MILPETKTELVRRGNKVVYDLGDKIAKVFNETKPVSDVFNEALNLARINECGIRSPKALEVTKLEGDEAGWALITTKVPGVTLAEKIEAIAKRVYHADGVVFEPAAQKEIAQLEALGFGNMPVCMAKTQYSFSDDATKLGAPRDFTITVRQVKVSAGAGFVVALTGSIMTMPGLGKTPAAHKIDVMEDGTITGLF